MSATLRLWNDVIYKRSLNGKMKIMKNKTNLVDK